MKLIDYPPLLSKKIPINIDLNYLQKILSRINSRRKNLIDEMQWEFNNITINFSSISYLCDKYPFYDGVIIIDPVVLAKIIFLSRVDGNNSTMIIRNTFDSIFKTLFYLGEYKIQYIDQIELKSYLNFMLMHSDGVNRPVKRLTPLSFKTYWNGVVPGSWFNVLREYNLPKVGFASFLSDKIVEKELKRVIENISAGDLTYRDWKDGGSFNHLTLDYGRFYVDHCSEYFDKNINFATALKITLNQASVIAKTAGFSVNKNTLTYLITPVIAFFLAGKQLNELKSSYLKYYSESSWEKLQSITLKHFMENLSALSIIDELTSDQEIDGLMASNGIDILSNYQREWIKYLVEAFWFNAYDETQPELKNLALAEIDCIKKVGGTNIDFEKIGCVIKKIINERLCSKRINGFQLTHDYFKDLGVVERKNKSAYVYNYIRAVEYAGIVKFIALTGWRESEYGFSVSDINVQANLDLLDQYVHPIRVEINWIVPKTNGNTKLKREITRSAYRYATKLALLAGAKNDDGCLHSYRNIVGSKKNSTNFIREAVRGFWIHFVQHYTPFKQLALLDELRTLIKENRAEANRERINVLSKRSHEENWERLYQDHQLREAYRRANDELDRVAFYVNSDSRKNYVWAYRNGTLDPEYTSLLDKYLSKETKEKINLLNSKEDYSAVFTVSVTNELLQDCLYPTPHAFRHMWGESVLRRFDGDVGWMIRSNFKHISQSMWLAYVRNKDNHRQYEQVKRKVISSLLKNYISKRSVDETGNVGEFGDDYAGAMNNLLRRLFRNTKTWTIEELENAVDNFALTEIEDIKSNPWGYCLLKKRHQGHAKCAEQGVPQRHNASPAFCLGCPNNLTQSGNLEGIILGISNDLLVLSNERIPNSFRRASFDTVKNALIHLKKLNADKDYIGEVEALLGGYKDESKLS